MKRENTGEKSRKIQKKFKKFRKSKISRETGGVVATNGLKEVVYGCNEKRKGEKGI